MRLAADIASPASRAAAAVAGDRPGPRARRGSGGARPGNLGATRLPRRRREEDPMRAFDALPAPLRRWLAEAARPWSPASCRRMWRRAMARGESVEAALARLTRAERRALMRDAMAPGAHCEIRSPVASTLRGRA